MPLDLFFQNDDAGAHVWIEDDGRTAYAYLFVDERIVGDIWLYNVGEDPESPDWTDKEKLPFENPAAYVREAFEPVSDPEEVMVSWIWNSTMCEATIYLRGYRHAVLRPGASPGWCCLATSANAVAQPLESLPPRSSDDPPS